MRLALLAALAATAGALLPNSTRALSLQASPSPWVLDRAVLPPGAVPSASGVTLLRGIAIRPDLALQDGVISFELAPPAGTFAGVAFRMASAADYEIVYFMPTDEGDRWGGVQYQPVFGGETTWQLYHEDGYRAQVPKSAGRALRVRLAVAGTRADVFVGDDLMPLLSIPELKRDPVKGAIGFWSAPTPAGSTGSELRGLATDTTAPVLALKWPPVPSERQLLRWRVSSRVDAPDGVHPPSSLPATLRLDERPIVTAEPTGLVNLTKALGNPAGPQAANVFGGAGWGMAYAGVVVTSAGERTVGLSVSYSDGLGVYLNGRRLFAGANEADSRYPNYLGIVGDEVDTIDLPLRNGRNEIVLAVTDKAFGWGFRARLASLDGLAITP